MTHSGLYPNDLSNSIYESGTIWSTCNLKIWDFLGRNKSDKIHLLGLSSTGSTSNQEDAANAVFVAGQDIGLSAVEINSIREIYEECGYDIYL